MKLLTYKEYLAMGKEKIAETLAPVRAMRAKKQAELKVAEMDEKIASQEANINELCTKEKLDFEAIIEAQDELALLVRKRSQFQQIVTEMFPD